MTSHARECFDRSPYQSVKHSSYFQVYDDLFSKYVGRDITFVEIGVLNGGSLFMWRRFFGDAARIIGIDLNPDAKKWERDGFEIHIGSQSDAGFWTSFFDAVGDVDIVLDDGGHTFEQQIITAECCLPHIRDGGLLVVEDTHTSYMAEFGGPSRFSFVGYARNKVDGINNRFGYFAKRKDFEELVYGIRFYESFAVFDVDRTKCIVSEMVFNNGASSEAVDFRYADAKAVATLTSFRDRVGAGEHGRAFRRLMKFYDRLIVRRSTKLSNRWRTLKLRRFFRF